MAVKYNSNVVKAGNAMAKNIAEHSAGRGASVMDVRSARNVLADLRAMKTSNGGQKAAVNRAINALEQAIQGAQIDPNARQFPGGGSAKPPGAR